MLVPLNTECIVLANTLNFNCTHARVTLTVTIQLNFCFIRGSRRGWEDGIRMDLRETALGGGVEWIQLA
jgi:hypothetical protein